MTEKDHQNNSLQSTTAGNGRNEQLDAAGKSLSEALRISFIILKVIMVVLIVVFFTSGVRKIGPDEEGLVLLFGKIRGFGEKRILKPGLHFLFPYPIHQIVKIPVLKKPTLELNSFWYYQNPSELLPEGPKERMYFEQTLDPIKDGFCITRSEKQGDDSSFTSGNDYSIVHCKWQLIYRIDDPELFYKNVYIRDVKPGEIYFNVIKEGVEPLLKSLLEDAVVSTMVNYTIDEVLKSSSVIPERIERVMQEKLDQTESGIKVETIQFTEKKWPRQVDASFQMYIAASQSKQRTIKEAEIYRENTLNEAVGSTELAFKLLAAIKNETDSSEKELDMLWTEAAGQSKEIISKARAYRTKVVEDAKANADYLDKILPEYRQRPRLVIQKIYQDAVSEVLDNAEEKMILQPSKGTKGTEIRVLINRDPTIKSK